MKQNPNSKSNWIVHLSISDLVGVWMTGFPVFFKTEGLSENQKKENALQPLWRLTLFNTLTNEIIIRYFFENLNFELKCELLLSFIDLNENEVRGEVQGRQADELGWLIKRFARVKEQLAENRDRALKEIFDEAVQLYALDTDSRLAKGKLENSLCKLQNEFERKFHKDAGFTLSEINYRVDEVVNSKSFLLS